MIQIGTVLQNRYLTEKQIGAGGMGAVYAAVDRRFDNRVALKETFYRDAEMGLAFEREAKLLNNLHHPVLPHVSDYFTEGGGYFLVMEFIEGEDLSAILARGNGFPVAAVARWTDALLDALDYLHSQDPPIIHRDIKPNNLKLTPRGDVILLDFGLAKLSSSESERAKSVFGYSRAFSPLEQIQGVGTDARSDIFALGATAYHLLTGKPPLDALARAAAIVAGKPDPLPSANELNREIPAAVAAVVDKALALNAERRFAAASEMREAWQNAVKLNESNEATNPAAENNENAILTGDAMVAEETASFPALAAFAADLETPSPVAAIIAPENLLSPRNSSGEPAAIQVPVALPAPLPVASAINFSPPTATHLAPPVREEQATYVRRSPKSLLPLAATGLIIVLGLATWLVANRAAGSSSAKPAQTPIAEASLPPAAEIKNAENPNLSNAAPVSEVLPKNSTNPDAQIFKTPISNDNAAGRREPAAKEAARSAEPLSTPKPVSPRPAQAAAAARPAAPPPLRGEPPPVSNIEKVLTGGGLEQREERRRIRAERRRQRDQMSEPEKEDLRRRRTQDILRRNRQPFPRN